MIPRASVREGSFASPWGRKSCREPVSHGHDRCTLVAATPTQGRQNMADTGIVSENTTAQDNGALIRRAYEAVARGDTEGAIGAFSRDIFWHVPGRGPLSRDYRGHAEVLGFFGHFMELSGGTFRLRVDDVLAKGDRVVVLCTESARRGERSWSSPQVHVW